MRLIALADLAVTISRAGTSFSFSPCPKYQNMDIRNVDHMSSFRPINQCP